MDALRHASLFAILTLLLGLIPLAAAILYLVQPTGRRRDLVPPLFLAGLFASLTGGLLGFLNVLRGFGMTQEFTAQAFRVMAIGAAESLVPMFLGFANLTVASLLVAVGLYRHREGPADGSAKVSRHE